MRDDTGTDCVALYWQGLAVAGLSSGGATKASRHDRPVCSCPSKIHASRAAIRSQTWRTVVRCRFFVECSRKVKGTPLTSSICTRSETFFRPTPPLATDARGSFCGNRLCASVPVNPLPPSRSPKMSREGRVVQRSCT